MMGWWDNGRLVDKAYALGIQMLDPKDDIYMGNNSHTFVGS